MKIGGVRVVDALQNVRLNITSADVRFGDTKDPGACAAARAALRTTDASQARVHLGRTYLKLDKVWKRYETSGALRSEIISFDRGGSFQPGEYALLKVRPSHREGVKQGPSSRKRTPGSSRKRVKPHVVYGVRQKGANR